MNTRNNQSFSVRNGYKKPKPIQHESMDDDLRKRLWGVFYDEYSQSYGDNESYLDNEEISISAISEAIWVKFFNNLSDEYNYNIDDAKGFIKDIFLKSEWHEVYDITEFIINEVLCSSSDEHDDQKRTIFIDEYNRALQKENSAYKIINELVTPITSKQEIKSIETAMATPYRGASNHINKALFHLSDRKKLDYENSIKESISAVESIAKEITGKEKSLTALTQKLKLHPNLKNGLDEIYNWTSKEGGIRHGKSGKPLKINQNTARFMLITCSAFVNYIVAENPKKS